MRDHLDRYYTKPWMTRALLRYVDVGGKVLEPCAGRGWIASVLREHGCEVTTGDLDPDVEVDHQWDFPEAYALGRVPGGFDWIITNPPFNCASQVVRAALESAPRVAMLLKHRWSESCLERAGIHALHPESMIITLPRDGFPGPTNTGRGTDNGSVAWFVWDGRKSETRHIRVLHAEADELRGQLDLTKLADGHPREAEGIEAQGVLL